MSTPDVLKGDFKAFQPPAEGRERERGKMRGGRRKGNEKETLVVSLPPTYPPNDIHSYLQKSETIDQC